MKIAVDVMSGDHPPEILIDGAIQAVNQYNVELVLVGKHHIIEKKLKTLKFNPNMVNIEHADEIIDMHDDPVQGFKQKKGASIIKAALLAKHDKVEGYFSPGNTGATLTTALMINGRLKGISRPSLAVITPTINNNPLVVLDMGANLDCKIIHYLQFAVMGETLIKNTFKIDKPKIALLNIGEEPSKGTDILKKVYVEMERTGFNFIGNIESKDVLEGKANVVVTDGFTGNILLKSLEGTMKSLIKITKREVKKSILYQTGALLMKAALENVMKTLSSEEYGSAPLLGANTVCMIGHGNSKEKDIKSGIKTTMEFIKNKINDHIIENIKHYKVGKLHVPFVHLNIAD